MGWWLWCTAAEGRWGFVTATGSALAGCEQASVGFPLTTANHPAGVCSETSRGNGIINVGNLSVVPYLRHYHYAVGTLYTSPESTDGHC